LSNTFVCKSTNFNKFIKHKWQDLTKFATSCENETKLTHEEHFHSTCVNQFQKIHDEDCLNTSMQNIFNVQNIVYDDIKSLIIPVEGFQPGLD
jgi:hypothetical protein